MNDRVEDPERRLRFDGEVLWPEAMEVSCVEDLANPQANIDLDSELGEQVARGERHALARVWRAGPLPGIAVSRRDVSTPEGQEAAERLREDGLTVLVRRTGGTAVPLGAGVFHFSLILQRTRNSRSTDAYYRMLTSLLVGWLRAYGVTANTGPLPGSYCDGSYNVLVGNKKLIGTAQTWRGGLAGVTSLHPGYIVAHACITVNVDFTWATPVINRFYELAGNDYRVEENSSVSLTELVPEWGTKGLDAAQMTRQAVEDLGRYVHSTLLESGRATHLGWLP